MAHISTPSSHVVSSASFYREASLTDTNNQESAQACTHTYTHVCVFKETQFTRFPPTFFFLGIKLGEKKKQFKKRENPRLSIVLRDSH